MEQTTINGRIAWVISLLEISQNAFAKVLETSASRVSNITSGRNKPDSDFLAAMARKFTNVNSAWLLTGEGQPLLTQNSSQINDKGYPILDEPYGLANILKEIDLRHENRAIDQAPKHTESPKKIFVSADLPILSSNTGSAGGFGGPFARTNLTHSHIPSRAEVLAAAQNDKGDSTYIVVDFNAAATYLDGYQSREYYESLSAVNMPRALVGASGQGILFQIEGDSMTPRFQHGDWVAAALLGSDELDQIQDSDYCVVVSTTNGIRFKRVKNRLNTSLKSLQCKSDNRRYRSFTVDSTNLLQVFRFVLHLSPNISSSNDELHEKVDHLEDATSDLRARYEQLAQQIAAMQGIAQPAHTPENAK